jgi:hypothetical protein
MSTAGVSNSNLYFNPSTGRLTAQIINGLSDRTLKENIETLSNVLNTLIQINPVSFNWKNSGERSYGIIAQDLEKVLPDLVTTDHNGVKSVSYIPLIAFLIAAVQQIYQEVEKLSSQNNTK